MSLGWRNGWGDAAAEIPGGGGAALLTLTTGTFPPNPSGLINEPLLAQIFAALREKFDYVIADCQPLPTIVDMMTLAHYADLVLYMVNVAHTPQRALAAHMETLSTRDRRQGMIINGVLGRARGRGRATVIAGMRDGWAGCGRG